jgi:hypothetical protein
MKRSGVMGVYRMTLDDDGQLQDVWCYRGGTAEEQQYLVRHTCVCVCRCLRGYECACGEAPLITGQWLQGLCTQCLCLYAMVTPVQHYGISGAWFMCVYVGGLVCTTDSCCTVMHCSYVHV